MSSRLSKRTASVAALIAVLSTTVAIPFTAFAQNTDGGFLMTLRLAERFTSRDTTSADDTRESTLNQAITDVRLSVNSVTRTQSLKLDVGGGYRFVDGPESDGYAGEFTDPSISLSYSQDAAASSIDLQIFANRVDLDNQSIFAVANNANGILDPDFDEITQDGGTRDRLSFVGRLSLRDDAPFGLNFTANVDDYSYDGLPDGSTLSDSTYGRVRAGARFDITQVLQVNAGVYFSETRNAGDTSFSRYGIDAGLILTQPNGQITVNAEIDDGDAGGQKHLSAARRYTLENTTASFGLGVSQASNDDVFVTGIAAFEHSFADESRFGTFTATADRSLSRIDEDLVTTLSVGTNFAVSPLANLTLSTDYAQSEDIVTGDTVDVSQISLTGTYALNPDWTASAGLGVQSRDPSGPEAATHSTTLSLGLSRNFDLRR